MPTVVLITEHTYDAQGRLISTLMPSGTTIAYAWSGDTLNAVTADSATVIENATTEAFGNLSGWTYGNAQSVNQLYDLSGRMVSHSLGTLQYDSMDRISKITNGGFSLMSGDRDFDYDALDRLTQFSSPGLQMSYAYDATNNLISETLGGNSRSFSIAATSNQLQSITDATGAGTAFGYDANGSRIQDGTNTLSYLGSGVLAFVTSASGITTYEYNGFRQRVRKTSAGIQTLFDYTADGRLAGEYDDQGGLKQEIIWAGTKPLAVLTPNGLYYIHSDHLETPRQIADASGNPVWVWDTQSYGANLANPQPTSGLPSFEFSMRFPGQYRDAETGLHQNWHRTYDPLIGRYLESDPIGLLGGINTYVYVGGSPISFIDPLGLWQVTVAGGPGPVGAMLTFGYNGGQINVGGYLGVGSGLAINIDPSDSGSHATGLSCSLRATGIIGLGANVEGSAEFTSADSTGTVAVRFPGTPVNFEFGTRNGQVQSSNTTFGFGAATFIGGGGIIHFPRQHW